MSDITPRDARMMASYRAGASLRAVAAQFGVSFQRCHQIMTEHGVVRGWKHRPMNWTPEMDATLRRLRARHVGIDAAAERLGVCVYQARSRMRVLGLPLATRPYRRQHAAQVPA